VIILLENTYIKAYKNLEYIENHSLRNDRIFEVSTVYFLITTKN